MKHVPIDAHRILPKLWIGSYPRVPETRNHFDAVVLCAQELQELPYSGVHVVKAPMDDATPTARELKTAVSAAQTVHALRKRDKRVLVTCAQGVNRSGFVTALAMMLEGYNPEDALYCIRKYRHPPIGMMPLSNPAFVQVLTRLGRNAGRERRQLSSFSGFSRG